MKVVYQFNMPSIMKVLTKKERKEHQKIEQPHIPSNKQITKTKQKMIYLNYCQFVQTSLKALKLSEQQLQSLTSFIKVTFLKRMDYFKDQDENQYRLRPRLKNQNKRIISKLFPSFTSNDVDFVCNIVVMHQLCEMELEKVDGDVAKLEEEMAITAQGVRKMKEKRRNKYRTKSQLRSQNSQQQISQSQDKSIFAKDTAESSQAILSPESQKE